MDCNTQIARSLVTIELRSWNPGPIPRVRHMCGEITWERLHEVTFSTFNRDPQEYTVHLHRDSFRGPSAADKPRMMRTLWTAGIYHGIALRIHGDRKLVVYANFENKV